MGHILRLSGWLGCVATVELREYGGGCSCSGSSGSCLFEVVVLIGILRRPVDIVQRSVWQLKGKMYRVTYVRKSSTACYLLRLGDRVIVACFLLLVALRCRVGRVIYQILQLLSGMGCGQHSAFESYLLWRSKLLACTNCAKW